MFPCEVDISHRRRSERRQAKRNRFRGYLTMLGEQTSSITYSTAKSTKPSCLAHVHGLHKMLCTKTTDIHPPSFPFVPGVFTIVGAIVPPTVGPGVSEHGRHSTQARCSNQWNDEKRKAKSNRFNCYLITYALGAIPSALFVRQQRQPSLSCLAHTHGLHATPCTETGGYS